LDYLLCVFGIKSDNKEVTDFVFASEFMKTIRENLRNI
jgi:hypothetical protein